MYSLEQEYNDSQYQTATEESGSCSSLDGYRYVEHMNNLGWPQDGVFTEFLSSADYTFRYDAERLVAIRWEWRVAPALALLIFEQ